MMRLDKFLTECGVGTRSEVKKHIKANQIKVNGILAEKPEMKIQETADLVEWNGKVLEYQKFHYYMFYKPAGCVTARKDNVHKTVMEYFPRELQKELSPVGRLDLDTEGILLFTDDGALNHHLMSPAHHMEKTYYAVLDKKVPPEAVELFQKGIDIGDEKPTLPAKLSILDPILCINTQGDQGELFVAELTLQEGRFHQVKRMFQAVGCKVCYLKRLSIGNLTLGDLKPGEYRELTEDEVLMLSKNE